MTREAMEYDVVIVGGGPSGLAAAIRLKQLAAAAGREVSVACWRRARRSARTSCPARSWTRRALSELLPDWQAQGAPITTPVDRGPLPTSSRAEGVSHPELAAAAAHEQPRRATSRAWATSAAGWRQRPRRSASRSTPGFAAAEVLYDEARRCARRGDRRHGRGAGRRAQARLPARHGAHAKYTLFAEGCRGSLSQEVMQKFNLRDGVDPQNYGIGIKELWQVAPDEAPARDSSCTARAGRSTARPAAARSCITWRTAWCRSASSSHLNYDESAPVALRRIPALQDAPGDPRRPSRAASGSPTARARSTRAACSRCPKLAFPGGALIGCAAGFVNLPRIKGSHNAMKSGMLAAEAAFAALGGRTRARRARRLTRRRGASRGCTRTSTRCAT